MGYLSEIRVQPPRSLSSYSRCIRPNSAAEVPLTDVSINDVSNQNIVRCMQIKPTFQYTATARPLMQCTSEGPNTAVAVEGH